MSNDINVDNLSEKINDIKINESTELARVPDFDQKFRDADLADKRLTTKVKKNLGIVIIVAFLIFIAMQVVSFVIVITPIINIGFDANQRFAILYGILGGSFVEIVGLLIVYTKYVLGK